MPSKKAYKEVVGSHEKAGHFGGKILDDIHKHHEHHHRKRC